ncbi:MAG TPA: hypothetical protein ENH13_01670 [Euryarchaeota archaeon]|nr:hypothetical protein [Euryarchaeota archaeon]
MKRGAIPSIRNSGRITALAVLILLILALVPSAQAIYGFQESDYRLQEQSNYCGIALMQTFTPEVSQDDIAAALFKSKRSLTYWGDFNYYFNRHGVKYHYTSLDDEFPAVVLLDAGTFRLTQNHFVLVLGRKNNFYTIFDPLKGIYRKPAMYLNGKKALVIE